MDQADAELRATICKVRILKYLLTLLITYIFYSLFIIQCILYMSLQFSLSRQLKAHQIFILHLHFGVILKQVRDTNGFLCDKFSNENWQFLAKRNIF